MGIQRRHIAFTGAAALLGVTVVAGRPAQAQSGDDRAVAQAVEALTKAMLEVDRAKLEALTADQLSYGHSAGRIENKAQFVENLLSRRNAFRSINLSDQTISIAGNDAIVRHLFTGETANQAGQVTPVRIGVLQVWQKQGGDWKLLARQAYRV
ncbi:nuclear transport factor 2 family protein [Siccirubricoccus sp. G192]|uniref:nuclear transport factor 2 family protein n=1 Tax=Siccirubricoccus sp. G192 TaxID=2849651 RepID=UPI001C2C8F88|nr:nuclear transport factor 2 family protein [Siccirubricoccus sp. G192]MBV1797591.1 nuclear transport factor 2 family protein [Siccirubricoccus sp. G192]